MAEHIRRWYITRVVLAACAAGVTYDVIEQVMPIWFQNLPKPLPEVLTHPGIDLILEVGLTIIYGIIAWIGIMLLVTSVVICALYSIIAHLLVDNLYVSIGYGLWAGATVAFFITSLGFFIDAPWEEGFDNEEFGPDPGGVWPPIMILQSLFSLGTLLFISFLHGLITWDALEGRRVWVIFISAITFILGAIAIAFTGGRNRPYPASARHES
jgi:hypothetical protein